MAKVYALCLVGLLASEGWAADTYTFGSRGQRGQDAERGRDGASGQPRSITVDGSAYSIETAGSPGEDAYGVAESGSSAYSCNQPYRPDYNLRGASGGNGGNGAPGGNGGNGGDIFLYLASKDKLSLLKSIRISNPGAAEGRGSPRPGRGGQGCYCQDRSWERQVCRWTFYRMVNGQKQGGWTRDEYIDCTEQRRPPYSKPYEDGQWEVSNTSYNRYECLNGYDGDNGRFGGEGRRGSHGVVSLIVGATAEAPRKVSLSSTLGEALGKTFELVNFDTKLNTGLTGLLASGSDVNDNYRLSTLYKQKVKIEWKAKANPKSSGTLDQDVLVRLEGDSINPVLDVNLPPILAKQLAKVGDTTVISITHVLKSSDPTKIAACEKRGGRGSYICEFTGACIYEEGACLPRF